MCEKKQIYLIGIGMGSPESLTVEAKRQLQRCDFICGAKRVLEGLEETDIETYAVYQPEAVCKVIRSRPECRTIAVVLSGDVGFYSGAAKLESAIEQMQKNEYEVHRISGISSVPYLAARLHVSWEDAALVSIHGRKQNYIAAIAQNEKTFLLFGGKDIAVELCEKMKDYGLEELEFWIGRNLSYKTEQILHKRGSELCPEDCSGLDVALILNSNPETRTRRHLEDGDFYRGKVPMTKSEIRTISIAKLQLTQDAVLYDIGAGTGTISVEAAMQSPNIRVYAVEKNPEAVSILKENKRRFCCDWMEIIQGTAPQVLEGLEIPTHAFIGGSAGNLKQILRTLKEMNPKVRIVINAISLETIKEVMEAEEDGLLENPEVVQALISEARKLGTYHMMESRNPIYIITEGKGV